MKWLGLVIGVVIGLWVRHGDAAFYLGAFGFAVGLVFDLVRGANAKSAVSERMSALESTVAKLSQRLDALERRRTTESSESPSRTGEIVGAPVIDMEAIPHEPPPRIAIPAT